jgi:hypothetical protein
MLIDSTAGNVSGHERKHSEKDTERGLIPFI